MRKYLIIWVGETASTVGSALTSFGLGIWILDKTGSVSLFSLNLLVYAAAGLLVMPLAGVAADRWNRKTVILLGDSGAALTSLLFVVLATTDRLDIWHVYVLTGAGVALSTFQWPAYKAMIPMLVPNHHLGRASALSQVGDGLAELLGPLIAGGLYVMSGVGLTGILAIDFATFLFATSILLVMPLPRHVPPAGAGQQPRSILRDIKLGWQYIIQRPGLVGLLAYFVVFTFFLELIYPLALPLLFKMTSPDAAGETMSKMAVGMFIGIAAMMVWGGPRRRIQGILIPGILSGLAIAVAGLRPSLTLFALGGFGYYLLLPVIQGSEQALWQSKVAHDMQGRVLATRSTLAAAVRLIALLLAGPLADHVFVPLLREDGLLAGSLGPIFGVGEGRGIGLLITLLGLLSVAATLVAYLYRPIRQAEDDIPDAPGIVPEAAS